MENTYHHTQLPEGRIPALRVEPMPADTNQSGEVFGGWVMSQVDLAGANTAMRYALSRYIVTRAVSSLTFEAPVLVEIGRASCRERYGDYQGGAHLRHRKGGGVRGTPDEALQ